MSTSLVGGPKDDVFVGRQAELSALLEVVARVEEGQPWLVTVEGESGIGKTALVKRGLASARRLQGAIGAIGPVRDRPRVRRHRAAASQCSPPVA